MPKIIIGRERRGDSGLSSAVSTALQMRYSFTWAAFTLPLTCVSLSYLSAIINPKQAKDHKSFNFDYSYWSHTTVTHSAPPVAQPKHAHIFALQCDVCVVLFARFTLMISVHSPRMSIMPHRCECTKTLERKCCFTPLKATTSASLLTVRQALASPTQ